MSDQTPRTQAEADALLVETRSYAASLEALARVHGADLTRGIELGERIDAYLSRPVADSSRSEGEYRIGVGNDGLLVVGPGDEQWDMSEEGGIESLVDRLNALSARSDAAPQEQALREALENEVTRLERKVSVREYTELRVPHRNPESRCDGLTRRIGVSIYCKWLKGHHGPHNSADPGHDVLWDGDGIGYRDDEEEAALIALKSALNQDGGQG
jgi:hypothetical protein